MEYVNKLRLNIQVRVGNCGIYFDVKLDIMFSILLLAEHEVIWLDTSRMNLHIEVSNGLGTTRNNGIHFPFLICRVRRGSPLFHEVSLVPRSIDSQNVKKKN